MYNNKRSKRDDKNKSISKKKNFIHAFTFITLLTKQYKTQIHALSIRRSKKSIILSCHIGIEKLHSDHKISLQINLVKF